MCRKKEKSKHMGEKEKKKKEFIHGDIIIIRA
jgi:hypothetical protein